MLEDAIQNPKTLNDRSLVDKDWGYEDWIVNGSAYCGKVLVMEEGWQSSKHMHPIKDETMLVIEGSAVMELWEDGPDAEPRRIALRAADTPSVRIIPTMYHRLSTPFGERVIIIEFSTHHKDSDVVRQELSGPLSQRPKKVGSG